MERGKIGVVGGLGHIGLIQAGGFVSRIGWSNSRTRK